MPQISIDNREATRRGAEYLRELGHTDVAIVTLPFDADRTRGPLTPELIAASTADTASERLAGAREVFPDATGRAAAASSIEEGLEAALALLADPATRPTAIIAQSDLLAAGVIKAADELGIAVPAELSVIGFDGIRVDGLQHDLTTLAQPSVSKGRAAGEAVVQLLAGQPGESVCFTSTLHVGDTTAAPRALTPPSVRRRAARSRRRARHHPRRPARPQRQRDRPRGEVADRERRGEPRQRRRTAEPRGIGPPHRTERERHEHGEVHEPGPGEVAGVAGADEHAVEHEHEPAERRREPEHHERGRQQRGDLGRRREQRTAAPRPSR